MTVCVSCVYSTQTVDNNVLRDTNKVYGQSKWIHVNIHMNRMCDTLYNYNNGNMHGWGSMLQLHKELHCKREQQY